MSDRARAGLSFFFRHGFTQINADLNLRGGGNHQLARSRRVLIGARPAFCAWSGHGDKFIVGIVGL